MSKKTFKCLCCQNIFDKNDYNHRMVNLSVIPANVYYQFSEGMGNIYQM